MGKLSHARIDSRLDALLQRAQRLRSEYEDSAASSEPSTERAWRGPPASPTSVWPRSASLDEGVDRARGEAGTSDTDIQRLIARAADYKADRELQALDDEIPLSPLPRIRDRPSLRWGERAGVSAAEKAAAAAAQRAAAALRVQEETARRHARLAEMQKAQLAAAAAAHRAAQPAVAFEAQPLDDLIRHVLAASQGAPSTPTRLHANAGLHANAAHVLGLEPAAAVETARKRYLALARRLHPDKASHARAAEAFAAVESAWARLGAP